MALQPQFVHAFGQASLDLVGAQVCDWITGATGGIINLRSWSAQLRTDATNAINNAAAAQSAADLANNGVSTVSNGVTSNITGSTPSSNASDVGNSVGILNTTVQSSSQPPQTVIVTSTQDVTIPTGCRTVVFNVFGGGGGGARGPVASGSGAAGGGGGVGGWQKDVSIAASSLPATLHCIIGTGGVGATTDNTAGGNGGTSKVTDTGLTTTYVQATGGAGGQPCTATATTNFDQFNGAAGTGNGISTLPGTHGGYGGWYGNNVPAEAGANGSSVNGGAGGGAQNGTDGGAGQDDTSTLTPGMAGSGGGGGGSGSSGSGHAGGAGGHPGGAGGGGGQFWTFGNNGNGGNGAAGEIWLKFVF